MPFEKESQNDRSNIHAKTFETFPIIKLLVFYFFLKLSFSVVIISCILKEKNKFQEIRAGGLLVKGIVIIGVGGLLVKGIVIIGVQLFAVLVILKLLCHS